MPARFSRNSSRQADSDCAASARLAADRSGAGLSSVSVEQARLRRPPAGRQSRGFYRRALLVEVGEDLLDHQRILDAGNDPDGATAGSADLDVDVDQSAGQPICTAVGCLSGCDTGKCRMHTRFKRCAQLIDARRSLGVFSSPSAHALGGLPLPRFAGVTRARCLLLGAKAPWKRVRFTLGLGTRAASLAMKSTGSKMTWVVPSR